MNSNVVSSDVPGYQVVEESNASPLSNIAYSNPALREFDREESDQIFGGMDGSYTPDAALLEIMGDCVRQNIIGKAVEIAKAISTAMAGN